jgi:hypothetical protein
MENGLSEITEISFGPPGFRVRTSILPINGMEEVAKEETFAASAEQPKKKPKDRSQTDIL